MWLPSGGVRGEGVLPLGMGCQRAQCGRTTVLQAGKLRRYQPEGPGSTDKRGQRRPARSDGAAGGDEGGSAVGVNPQRLGRGRCGRQATGGPAGPAAVGQTHEGRPRGAASARRQLPSGSCTNAGGAQRNVMCEF